MFLFSKNHTESWKETFCFIDEASKKAQVDEKIEILKDFEIEDAESYRSLLITAKTPSSLDRICCAIICNNL